MDSAMSSQELERLKERTKINFFQVEKRLAEDDIRMDDLEKSLKELKDLKKSLEKVERQQAPQVDFGSMESQLAGINSNIKRLESEIYQVQNSMQKFEDAKQLDPQEGMKDQIEALMKNMVVLEDDLRQIKNHPLKEGSDKTVLEDLRSQVSTLLDKVNFLSRELQKVGPNTQSACGEREIIPMAETTSQIMELNDSLKSVKAEVSEVKSQIQKIRYFDESQDDYLKGFGGDIKTSVHPMPDIEEKFELIGKDLREIESMRLELGNDRNLYLELRTAVLASIEKFAGIERDVSKRLEELGELSRNVEATRKKNEILLSQAREELSKFEDSYLRLKGEMREEVRDEITRLEMESAKIEQNNDSKFENIKFDVYAILDKGFEKQNHRITEYGDKVDAVAAGFTSLKTEVVERTIDEEMNKLLIILNDKLRDLATRDEMESIKTELKYRLEQVRSPEIRPLEARIIGLEEDISELKKLLRGISQRLPVIVE